VHERERKREIERGRMVLIQYSTFFLSALLPPSSVERDSTFFLLL
jgi:hypothetical protein